MLTVKAGPAARRWLETEGFNFDGIQLMLGASGGPKWLVLSALDRLLAGEPRRQPLHLLGTSSGAWRFSCYGQHDAQAALKRLETAYIEMTYPDRATPAQVSVGARRVLNHVLGPDGPAEILRHPTVRYHVMAAGTRHLLRSERLPVQLLGLIGAGALNLIRRPALGLCLWRALFSDPRDPLPVDVRARTIPLRPDNVELAVLASGSIPLRLEGVRDIPGAPPGVYRDGALLEYHFDLPSRGFVLYPHFSPHLVPGWLDRFVPWRRVRRQSLDRMILVHPSPEFVASLPGGRIPDLTDFRGFSDGERIRRWREVARLGERLAEEFARWRERPVVEDLTPAASRPLGTESILGSLRYLRA